ncbi:MAG: hypothetical protein Q7S95_00395 [bacterium]|nr:hypothetical protein [bacterium]
MDFEGLSKSQLVLLTILVNFITSVATGILTVSLLDHAPPYVTQTVNRVVERTIETVSQAVPAAVIAAPAPSNQDLVTAAIGADAARLVAIYPADAATSTPAFGIGTYLSKVHAVATAAGDALPKEAKILFSDGSMLPASLSKAGHGIAIYGFADDATLPKITSPTLLAAKDLRLGETALAIGADGAAATGIVSRISENGIRTTLPDIGAGSAVVDLAGNLIGLSAGGTPGLLISAEYISNLLAATSTASIAPSP